MNIRRALIISVVVVAVAALAVPLVGLSTHASGVGGSARPAVTAKAQPAPVAVPVQQGMKLANGQEITPVDQVQDAQAGGQISAETWRTLGIPRTADPAAASKKILKRLKSGGSSGVSIQSGQPQVLNGKSATSAALMTNIGGRDNQFSEVTLLADWDGREDCAADREAKVDDFSTTEPDIDFVLTRTAISEHTFANGWNESIYYYGDSVGNVWVGADTTGDGRVDSITQINLPTVLNAFGTINSDDQVTVTGLAVNPVADLGSFSHVNGAYSPTFGPTTPGTPGVTGEILYVTYTDTESGLNLAANNTPVRSGLLAFPVSDVVSPAKAGIILTDTGFPVTVGAAFGVAFSVFSNIAGCAVDDDGSVYFQQVDLVQFTGANIVKAASKDDTAWQDRSLATSGFGTLTTLNPTNGLYSDASGPVGGNVSQITRYTNYSGTSTLFGNIVAINTGPCNVLYAAVSRSAGSGDDGTSGLFPAPSAFASGTPSMVISFADCSGAFDICTAPVAGTAGNLPMANGIADVAQNGLALSAGVNNFRVFVLGNGPDIRPGAGTSAVVTNSTLKIDMQID
ncbi:MAG TPA: hypothetical protein VLM38_02965, partial [Blastocatellia bacterium]|nr:hypothetical protein [Blastocatellia bacterium]